MEVDVCRPTELGPAETARWHSFQHAGGPFANPFLSPEFARAVDRARPGARVAVAQEAGTVVGFLPFSAGRSGFARPVGAGFCDLQAFVHREGLEWDLADLLRRAGLRAWQFDHLLGAQLDDVHLAGGRVHCDETFLIDLGSGWDAYATWAHAHRHRHIKTMERKQRSLLEAAPDLAFTFDGGAAGLPDLLGLKSAQCRRLGWKDAFSVGWSRRLVEELSETRGPACTGVLSTLRAGGRTIAADLSLRSSSVYAGWLISYDDAWKRRSPGVVRWWYVLQALASEGIGEVDLGRGIDEFKRRFSTGTRVLGVGWAPANRGVAAAGRALTTISGATRPVLEDRARHLVRRARHARYARTGREHV